MHICIIQTRQDIFVFGVFFLFYLFFIYFFVEWILQINGDESREVSCLHAFLSIFQAEYNQKWENCANAVFIRNYIIITSVSVSRVELQAKTTEYSARPQKFCATLASILYSLELRGIPYCCFTNISWLIILQWSSVAHKIKCLA